MLAPEALEQLPPEQKREALRLRMEQLRRNASSSLISHCRFCLRTDQDVPVFPYAYHREWADLMENRDEFPWVGIVAPPGYAKSTWWTLGYTTWRIGQTGGAIRMGIVQNTAEAAWGWSRAIADVIESDHFKLAYPEVVPDYDRGWRNNARYTNNTPPGHSPTLAAMGIAGPILGRRFDEIVLDDPTTYEQALSPTVMLKQRNWLKNTLIKRLPAGLRPPSNPEGKSRITVVFTRWGPNDLYDTLEDIGFKMVTFPAMGYWDRQATCTSCGEARDPDLYALLRPCEHCGSIDRPQVNYGNAALEPQIDSIDELTRERENDELIFELVMQGNPMVVTGNMFDPLGWADKRGVPPTRKMLDRVVMAVDSAGGKSRKKGDYFVAAVLGLLGTQVWVLDIVRGRFNVVEQKDKVIQTAQVWEPDSVVIETKNEGNALYQQMMSEHWGLPLETFEPVRDKVFRASPLAAAYRAGLISHPAGASWIPSYESELQAFPDGPHDDQVDAVGLAYSKLAARPRVRTATG